MTPESSTQSHEVRRFSATQALQYARDHNGASERFVSASDFDALALRHREEVAASAKRYNDLFNTWEQTSGEAEALRARVGETTELLQKAEAALSDIGDSEGALESLDAEVEWLRNRAAEMLPPIRALLNATKGDKP